MRPNTLVSPPWTDTKQQRTGLLLLGLACLSWVGLMIPLWNGGPLVLDEHVSYWIIDSDLPSSTYRRSLDQAATPPLASWVQAASVGLFGKSEWALRLPSAMCTLLSLGVVYLVGMQLRQPILGGLAALILIWNPELLDDVRIARCYGQVALLSAVVVWLTVWWQRDLLSWRRVAAWSLGAAALIWTHYISGLLVVMAAGWLAVECYQAENNRRTVPYWMAGMVLLGVLCAGLVPSVLRLQAWGPVLNFRAVETPIWEIVGPFWWAGLPVGLLLAKLIKSKRFTTAPPVSKLYFITFAVCSIVPLLLLALLAHGDLSSLANPRYRVTFIPAAALLASALLCRVGSLFSAGAGTAALIAVMWFLSDARPWQAGRLGSAPDAAWRELTLSLKQNAQPGSPLLVGSNLVEAHLIPAYFVDPLFMEYVAARVSKFYLPEHHPRIGLPTLWVEDAAMDEFYREQMKSKAAAQAGGSWIAAATDTDLGIKALEKIRQLAVEAGLKVTVAGEWDGATLLHVSPPSTESPE
ncbi:ArnT family glycosyltransferase [Planctomicrobium piriforme]|uniref:Dolichyl-phosphate-mannose-protein mannosyltransferase n=1 Tax=Planctomicrobium piriforme TaxID=1576369 RepID=A0A1I3F148_9PLAN|nr:glycosyltransferase family 39 protein [Planctomicrobium piriforme]SFI05005.1 Dolichyl-phosphate-mannose-protein mannosyltransferase [Planctomicrobium piriforme]